MIEEPGRSTWQHCGITVIRPTAALEVGTHGACDSIVAVFQY